MADEEREDRLFSRQEAENLLPVLEPLLNGAIQNKRRLEELDSEFAQVQNRVLLYGGILPPYGLLAQKRMEREALVTAVREAIARIEETGCVVKDLDQGLVDFLSEVNREQVYLCWKLGEERIRYWHRMDEGFAGRKPLLGPGDVPAEGKGKPN